LRRQFEQRMGWNLAVRLSKTSGAAPPWAITLLPNQVV